MAPAISRRGGIADWPAVEGRRCLDAPQRNGCDIRGPPAEHQQLGRLGHYPGSPHSWGSYPYPSRRCRRPLLEQGTLKPRDRSGQRRAALSGRSPAPGSRCKVASPSSPGPSLRSPRRAPRQTRMVKFTLAERAVYEKLCQPEQEQIRPSRKPAQHHTGSYAGP